jgi:FMN reductase
MALKGAAEAGETTELLDIKELSLPICDPANKKKPEFVVKLCRAFYQADGLICTSPMYNGTIRAGESIFSVIHARHSTRLPA